LISSQTFLSALAANRALSDSTPHLQNAVARLASGKRVNSAKDDAAGLAIASRLQSQSRALNVNLRNLNDLVSTLQVADGALANSSDNLQRIRELAVQAANGTNTLADRQALQAEASQLIEASRTIQANTDFNGRKLLDGSFQSPAMAGSINAPGINIAPVFQGIITDQLFRYAVMAQAKTGITPGNALSAGDLTINKVAVGASSAGSGAGQTAASAWAIANAINAAQVPNVSAQAATVITGGSVSLPGGDTVSAGDISINGIPVQAGSVANAINGIAGQTGVSAQLTSSTGSLGTTYVLTLTAADGRNINVTGAGGFGIADTTAVGTVTVTGPVDERPKSDLAIGGNAPGNAGFNSGSVNAIDTGDTVLIPLDENKGYDMNPNLLSAEEAQATIGIMDRRLDRLVDIRTRIGAALNTLDYEQHYLGAADTNVQAAASRITDTDYAKETAQLTRQKLLQTTGQLMSAQANSSSSLVLLLLLRNLN